VVGLASLVAAPTALAQVSESSNWAGYAVHRSGVTFHSVSATWRQPRVTCPNGRETFSSYWVGLGGYSINAKALEQTGTEVDCTASGKAHTFAWYEVVPAPSVPIKLQVPSGDLIQGQVAVTGHKVTVLLRDLTRHTQFSKTLSATPIDIASAEWIVEAPSECLALYDCVTLPLANFGSTPFESAVVQSTTGHSGSISDPFWSATEIKLIPHHSATTLGGHRLGRPGDATPSTLQSAGSAFSVTYSPSTSSGPLAPPTNVSPGAVLTHGAVAAP
jgi:hypothetical protein